MNRGLWVIDVEQYPNFHSLCALNVDTFEEREFVIHSSRDDRINYLAWLKTCKGWVTFNGLRYDYPLVHNILTNKSFFMSFSADKVVKWLYTKSKSIIESEVSQIPEGETLIPQYDLFKINHYDRPQKSCSLKWIAFTLRYELLESLPLDPHTEVTDEQAKILIEYNMKDVKDTYNFWLYCQDAIKLREQITLQYGIDARNMSDTSIGSNIIAKFYEDKTGIPQEEFRKYRHNSSYLTFRDIINPIVKFESPELQSFLRRLKHSNENLILKKFNYHLEYDNTKYKIAKGGLHSEEPPTLYQEEGDYMLIDLDFGSYYPNLMKYLDIFPPTLGREIIDVLSQLIDQRLKAKANNDKFTSDSLKLTINSLFGLQGSAFSFMFSMESMLKVTINGQLLLLMLIEKITREIGAKCYYANTDGCSFKIHKSKKQDFLDCCADFQQLLPIPLEFARYIKCYISNVNNYIILKDDKGKVDVKHKGWFELPHNQPPHKNNSKGIIAIAIHRYVVSGIPIEDTIKNHLKRKKGYYEKVKDGKVSYEIPNDGIFDFLIGVKAKKSPVKGKPQIVEYKVDNGILKERKLSDVTRFFISNSGGKLFKKYSDDSQTSIVADKCYMTELNLVKDKYAHYDIDYNYYIKEANKLMKNFTTNQQMSLF